MTDVKYILFDLDGTITDPYEGITKSVEYSLEKFGIKVDDRRELLPFIGPPLKYGYMTYFNMSEEDALKAVEYYREYYPEKGIFDCTLYEGIRELLERLSKKYKLVLATSKPQPFAERIIEKFGLTEYFYKIIGATFDEKVSEKADVIRKVLSDLNISPDEAVMIGDRCYDTDGATQNGVAAIGVTYGYGKRDEHVGAKVTVDSVDELSRLF
ncbi:MAG: HAD family hydrolase [Ruminococcaceae bacterium]|nr:HAD family hydrolase [Oscillospiraceae bacterium]